MKKTVKRPKFPQRPPFSIPEQTYSVMEIVDIDQEGLPIALLVHRGRLLKSPRIQLSSASLKGYLLASQDRLLVRLQ